MLRILEEVKAEKRPLTDKEFMLIQSAQMALGTIPHPKYESMKKRYARPRVRKSKAKS